jgi:peptidoglycan hydrolase CwlO-like protein
MSKPPTATRWSWTRRVLGPASLAAVLVLGVAAPSPAQSSDEDPRAKREQVRSDAAEVASSVDALEADADEVSSALAALESDVAATDAALADARRDVDSAELAVERAEEQVAITEAELGELTDLMRSTAIDAYMGGRYDDALDEFSASDANEAAVRKVLLETGTGDHRDVAEELRGTRARLEAERAEADARREEAEARRSELDQRSAAARTSRDRQASLVADVDERLNARLGEAAALADLDGELSSQIAADEARVADLARQARARDEAAKEQAEAAEAASPPAGGGGGGGPVVIPPDIPTSGDMVNVGGIVVHSSIAGNLRGLLGAAASAGISLSGNGYRDINRQIALRQQNCGSSQYAIWQMSPSACSPETAIPGRSMHEQGLAIDFTVNGQFVNSRGSSGFQWLAANAPGYGFRNLPSEPWHWSSTGQ